MNPENIAHIVCEQSFDTRIADRIETALSDPSITSLLIEFHRSTETERFEIDRILNDDPSIDRLRALIRKMEQGPKAIAALVSGSIGGLQLEMALACHVRFAPVGMISFDFPWLKFGLMPMLGGTQRLPRICGIELAAKLLLGAEKVNLSEETAAELFEFKDQSLPAAAIKWAEQHSAPGQPWDQIPQELSPSYSQTPFNRQLLQKIYLKLRHRFVPEEAAPTAVLRCLQAGLERSIDAGIRLEAEQWAAVRRSRSTVNRLKTLHLAQQKARQKVGHEANSIKRIGVLGAGLMGTGIAYTAARAGYEVFIAEVSHEASERSLQQIKKVAQRDANSGLLKQEMPTDLLSRVRWSSDLSAFGQCDFIIEAIFERASLKKTKLAEIAALVGPQATIASNTTTLPISDLALACERPDRFLGTHFFAPVDRMELLEIVVGEKTAPETIERALLLAKALNKTPIVVRDGPGFFTSRVVAAYLQEALFMVRAGISPWMIDNVAQNAGMILGPLAVADLMGLDLLTDIFESLAVYRRGAARDASESIEILKEFTKQSRLGKKSGAGIYEYNSRHERADSAEVRNLFVQASKRSDPVEIEQRLFVIQTIEALHAMHEGIVDDNSTADLASVLGWSYPAGRGGVMSYLEMIGLEEFESARARLQGKWGERFAMPG